MPVRRQRQPTPRPSCCKANSPSMAAVLAGSRLRQLVLIRLSAKFQTGGIIWCWIVITGEVRLSSHTSNTVSIRQMAEYNEWTTNNKPWTMTLGMIIRDDSTPRLLRFAKAGFFYILLRTLWAQKQSDEWGVFRTLLRTSQSGGLGLVWVSHFAPLDFFQRYLIHVYLTSIPLQVEFLVLCVYGLFVT